ncbi:hypothetical protein [Streptomyces shenzhenensis]|uniref:Uncharacterized protein n=1 Tax=Streptomyces shenzhenensis TaxID=943815 RepID=A0A3M0IEX6_9ACTN|nr:hypothetical protein [Streptomyces shenzhenensis]RMB87052.1 hypothetical protein CTZ28_03755 [Streptomyces shenzhenensis]
MSDTPAKEIRADEIPSLLLRMIPESADSITETYHRPAKAAVVTEETWVRPYRLLAECFTMPVLMPELESDSPDTELLSRCWEFVERIVAHPTEHVSGAVYFEVLEQLLNAPGLVEAAWPYMKERTRARTLKMLDSYDVRLPGINWR